MSTTERCGHRPPDAPRHVWDWCHLPVGHEGQHAYVECGTRPARSPFSLGQPATEPLDTGRQVNRAAVVIAALAGLTVGLLLGIVFDDQPERVLVPVERPAPSFRVEPEGARA